MQGVGGAVQYPKDYLKQAYKRVRQRGGICIADEVRSTPPGNTPFDLIGDVYRCIIENRFNCVNLMFYPVSMVIGEPLAFSLPRQLVHNKVNK